MCSCCETKEGSPGDWLGRLLVGLPSFLVCYFVAFAFFVPLYVVNILSQALMCSLDGNVKQTLSP